MAAPAPSPSPADQLAEVLRDFAAGRMPLLLSAEQVAEQLGVSRREIGRLNSRGRLPAPIVLGGGGGKSTRLRWGSAELIDWVAAGCPDRETWVLLRSQHRGRARRG